MGTSTKSGIIQYSLKYIFEKISDFTEPLIIKASFYEIYNEDILDLLNLKNKSKNIIIRDTSLVTVSGLTEITVCDYDDVIK